MTSRFDDLGSAYITPSLLEMFGESVVYCPQDGEPRPIQAIVRDLGQEEPSAARVYQLEVSSHPADGIALSELDRGSDEIELVIDGRPMRRKIADYAGPTAGMLTLEVR